MDVLYLRSPSCPLCAEWERYAAPAWDRSVLREHVTFHVISFAHFSRLDGDVDWPNEWRWVRDAEAISAGTPRFLIVQDGRIVAHGFGVASWGGVVVPTIEQLLRCEGPGTRD